MKYDITKSPTKGAKRVLNSFSESFFSLLTKKSFDIITVNEICDMSGYPRATFYNYFSDKYDLLNYLWYCITYEIRLEEYKQMQPGEYLPVFFNRLYDLFERFELQIRQILQNNSGDSYFISSCRIYLNTQVTNIFIRNPLPSDFKVPYELLTEHYSNTIYLVMQWRFLNDHVCSREQAYEYVLCLLGRQSTIFK